MRRLFIFSFIILLFAACRSNAPDSVGFLLGNYALVPQENSVHVVDVSDPTAPEGTATIPLPGPVIQVESNGRFAYIIYGPHPTIWEFGLQIVELSDPSQPTLRGSFLTTNFPGGLAVQDEVAYLAGADGLLVVDVSNPDSPQQVGQPLAGGSSVAISGSTLVLTAGGCSFRSGFCSGGMTLFDLTDPKRPSPIKQLQTEELPGYDVAVADGFAFATGKGMWVVDLNSEGDLSVNGRYERSDDLLFPASIGLHDQIAYVQQHDGLYLLDISQPTTPTLISHLYSANYITDLIWRDNTVYLAGWFGLDIIDVTDPAQPQQIGHFGLTNPVPDAPQPTPTP